MELLQTTLCYLEKDGAYLMLHRVKKKNDVNHDKWVGVGGKFEPGEDALACALREVREETGLTMHAPVYRGIVDFFCDPWPAERMHLHGFFRRDDRLRRGVLRVGGQGRRAGSSDLAGGQDIFQAAGGGRTVFPFRADL